MKWAGLLAVMLATTLLVSPVDAAASHPPLTLRKAKETVRDTFEPYWHATRVRCSRTYRRCRVTYTIAGRLSDGRGFRATCRIAVVISWSAKFGDYLLDAAPRTNTCSPSP